MLVNFHKVIESPWTELSPIRVGNIPSGLSTPDVFVLVEVADEARIRIDVYADHSEESLCFQEAVLWHNWVAIGFGHKLHLVPIDRISPTTIDLGSYFGYLYPTDDFLLVATAEQLHCFNRDGTLKWSSPELGIDGVKVHHIGQDIICGDGEWDPPDGWKPFQIWITSGKLVNP